jgi:PKHD-type hydroxylase
MSKEPTVRKMTMVTLLNDPKEFKGGELQIIDSKKSLPLKQGYAIFFASFIAHRVLPVKKGTRISMPIWFGGPPLT